MSFQHKTDRQSSVALGAPVRVPLGQWTAGHRERQLDVVRRVGSDEVDAVGLQVGQQREGIAAA